MLPLTVVAVCVNLSVGHNTWATVPYACFKTEDDCTTSLPHFRKYLKDEKAECLDLRVWNGPYTGVIRP